MERKAKRIVLGKIGLDGHDNGLRIISRWLMERGYEIIYAGLYNSPTGIVRIAIEESADLIGISFLCGAHISYTDQVVEELKANGTQNIKLVVGGVIPPDDVADLKSLGADAILTPGTAKEEILDTIECLLS